MSAFPKLSKGRINFIKCCLLLYAISACATALAQSADGKVTYSSKNKPVSLVVSSGQFLTGPDEMSTGNIVKRLLFTSQDISAKVVSAKTMKSLDAEFVGLQVDITGAPRLLYWLVLNNQLIQYSGTAQPEALVLTENSKDHIAGTLNIDDSKAGGPKIDIRFDLRLARSFEK